MSHKNLLIDRCFKRWIYLPAWIVARGFIELSPILIGLLVGFRCLGTGEPTVGVEHSEDKPESRASSPFRFDETRFSSSTTAFPLAIRGLPVKTVRFFAPLDDSITLVQTVCATIENILFHRISLLTYFIIIIIIIFFLRRHYGTDY